MTFISRNVVTSLRPSQATARSEILFWFYCVAFKCFLSSWNTSHIHKLKNPQTSEVGPDLMRAVSLEQHSVFRGLAITFLFGHQMQPSGLQLALIYISVPSLVAKHSLCLRYHRPADISCLGVCICATLSADGLFIRVYLWINGTLVWLSTGKTVNSKVSLSPTACCVLLDLFSV